MIKNPHSLLILLLCLSSITSLAQNDSSYLDLGRMKLKKEFTQSVTIKGSDLEKMPFSTLSEALQVWATGAYTIGTGLQYVVDGNFVHDVNAWSIYDIDEVVLVQNAVGVVNGSALQSQLVYIKTKTGGRGKRGFTIAGQSALVTRKDIESETNFYHQLHLSGYMNFKNIQFGISANYLRDVNPNPDTFHTVIPYNFDRIRLNGWFRAQLGEHHTLTVRLGYTPQNVDAEYDLSLISARYYAIDDNKQSAIYPSAQLQSAFGQLTNDLHVAYLSTTEKGTTGVALVSLFSSDVQQITGAVNTTVKGLLIRDQVAYHAHFGNWQLEPALNFQYRNMDDKKATGYIAVINNQQPTISTSYSSRNGDLFTLTPSISLYHSNAFHIQAGVLYNPSSSLGYHSKRVHPFASLMFDPVKATQPTSTNSLKIFASYAQGEDYYEQGFRLNDFKTTTTTTLPIPIFGSGFLFPNPDYTPVTKIIQAGTVLGIANNKFQFSYQYDQREFFETYTIIIPQPSGGGTAIVSMPFKTWFHRFGITAQVAAGSNFQWNTGLNLTTGKIKADDYDPNLNPGRTDLFNSKNPLTGGWVNSFRYKQWSLGASVLYLFNENRISSLFEPEKVNSILLQNLYLGYQPAIARIKTPEIWVSLKNLTESDKSMLSDKRKFITLGVKANL